MESSWIFEREQHLYRLLRRGQIKVFSVTPFYLPRSASVCWLSLKIWPFIFHHGSILENPGFGVMVMDIQSQTWIFCVLKGNWQFLLPKPAVFPLCFFVLQWWGWETNAKCSLQQFNLWAQNSSPCCICFHKASKTWLLLLRDVLGEAGRENPLLLSQGKAKSPRALLYLC